MKLSTRARYALRAMVDIAAHQDAGRPVSVRSVADRTGISLKYLEQLVVGLRNRSLLRSVAGRRGGYLLTRDPEEITLGEVIRASIGPVGLVDCTLNPDFCTRGEHCACRPLWMLVQAKLQRVLEQYTLAHICDARLAQEVREELDELLPGSG